MGYAVCMPAVKAKIFEARLERLPGNLGWVIARVPFDVQKTWGTGGRMKVKVEIAGELFRKSLFPTREGTHFLLVNNRMQQLAKAKVGSIMRFKISPDTEERKVINPAELTTLLKRENEVRKWYETMNHSTRYEIAKWVAQPKSDASRSKRAQQIVDRLASTMAAEVELPPQIAIALDRTPYARKGWERMTPLQRRSSLLAIFYYQSAESRAKRLAKVVQEAAKRGSR
jgi:uncharacterized protein YdeI (YjbR/CyaY-like superfamily)